MRDGHPLIPSDTSSVQGHSPTYKAQLSTSENRHWYIYTTKPSRPWLMAPTMAFMGQEPIQGHTLHWVVMPLQFLHSVSSFPDLDNLEVQALICTILSVCVCLELSHDWIRGMRFRQESHRSDAVSFSVAQIRRYTLAVCTITGDVNVSYQLIKMMFVTFLCSVVH